MKDYSLSLQVADTIPLFARCSKCTFILTCEHGHTCTYTHGTGTTGLHIFGTGRQGKAYSGQQTTHVTLQKHTQQSEACGLLQLEAGGHPCKRKDVSHNVDLSDVNEINVF